MKYYSDLTKHLYDTEAALKEAEAKVKREEAEKEAAEKMKKEARSKRAKEVTEALKEANDAQAKAIKLLKEFTNDYGYFHTSYSTSDVENPTFDFFNILDKFLK